MLEQHRNMHRLTKREHTVTQRPRQMVLKPTPCIGDLGFRLRARPRSQVKSIYLLVIMLVIMLWWEESACFAANATWLCSMAVQHAGGLAGSWATADDNRLQKHCHDNTFRVDNIIARWVCHRLQLNSFLCFFFCAASSVAASALLVIHMSICIPTYVPQQNMYLSIVWHIMQVAMLTRLLTARRAWNANFQHPQHDSFLAGKTSAPRGLNSFDKAQLQATT